MGNLTNNDYFILIFLIADAIMLIGIAIWIAGNMVMSMIKIWRNRKKKNEYGIGETLYYISYNFGNYSVNKGNVTAIFKKENGEICYCFDTQTYKDDIPEINITRNESVLFSRHEFLQRKIFDKKEEKTETESINN